MFLEVFLLQLLPFVLGEGGGPDAILFFGFGAPIVEQDTTRIIHPGVERKEKPMTHPPNPREGHPRAARLGPGLNKMGY